MHTLWIMLAVMALCADRTTSAGRKEPTISECAAKGGECDETKGRPVCGTDNQTYPTRCHLIRAQCSGHVVSLKHRGSCRECIESRSYVLQHRSTTPNKFVPRCRDDGTYAAVQCMDNAGCWCSDPQGKPVPNTTTRTGRPNCPKKAKSNTRRSPQSHLNLNRPRRGCTRADQVVFNANLIRVFHSEHGRLMLLGQLPASVGLHGGSNGNGNGGGTALGLGVKSHHASASALSDKAIVDWKFALLDANRNHQLERQEFRELKRLVRKAVKPKRCARTFGKFCDIDNDDRLSRQEWINCLSKDGVNHDQAADGSASASSASSASSSFSSSPSSSSTSSASSAFSAISSSSSIGSLSSLLSASGGVGGGVVGVGVGDGNGGGGGGGKLDPFTTDSLMDDYNEEEEDPWYDDESGEMNGGPSGGKPAVTFYEPGNLVEQKTTSSGSDLEPAPEIETPETGCLADRNTALDDQHSRSDYVYVPECTPDGRYQRVQCYKSAGYCWCVNEDTGKNIAGTSVKDRRPDCAVNTTRPMKGCPEPKKLEFLRELRTFLARYTAMNTTTGVNQTKFGSEDERVATIVFVLLDKNKNAVWERKEWKLFRELVTSAKSLRKCGKKMPRYCDINNDKKITMSEWLQCVQAHPVSNASGTNSSTNGLNRPLAQTSKLRGPNPLESILKE